ncbi:discoidin domain-containing protein, partial [Micromonospora arborensis]|uniref:discoidin domain-containing protein n=1 Tax=Micromonospora arborensis TaxID=2116518 RepID=UPI003429F5C3
WSSVAQSDPQWLADDLGAVWQVTQVRLSWQLAYAKAYHVDVSVDGTTWRTVYETSNGTGGVAEIAIARTPVRHVRVVGTARASTRYGYSIFEFEVR